MRELKLTLDFACSACEEPISVTVECRGRDIEPVAPHLSLEGLAVKSGGEDGAVAVNVPCPTCGQINRLTFDSTGHVRSVKPMRCFRVCPEPSVN
jgi:hypothetical protein